MTPGRIFCKYSHFTRYHIPYHTWVWDGLEYYSRESFTATKPMEVVSIEVHNLHLRANASVALELNSKVFLLFGLYLCSSTRRCSSRGSARASSCSTWSLSWRGRTSTASSWEGLGRTPSAQGRSTTTSPTAGWARTRCSWWRTWRPRWWKGSTLCAPLVWNERRMAAPSGCHTGGTANPISAIAYGY